MAPSRPAPFTQSTRSNPFIQRDNAGAKISEPPAKSKSHARPKSNAKLTAQAQSKSTMPTASNRMLTDVLLSVKPAHLANIVSRRKNHECREYRLRDGVTRLWLYETGEGGEGRSSITYVYRTLFFSRNIPPISSPALPVLSSPLSHLPYN